MASKATTYIRYEKFKAVPMSNDYCSFCGSPIAIPSDRSKPTLVVAGPTVFICRECVGICIEVMSDDAEWRDKQIAVLTAKRRSKTNFKALTGLLRRR
jgi:hypothetical protein